MLKRMWLPAGIVAEGMVLLLSKLFVRLSWSRITSRLIYTAMYFIYLLDFVVSFVKIGCTCARPFTGSAELPVVHVSGPHLSRKGDIIRVGDLVTGTNMAYRITVIGKVVASVLCSRGLSVKHSSKMVGNKTFIDVMLAPKELSGSSDATIFLRHGGGTRSIVFRADSVNNMESIKSVTINRLKHGSRFAFSWRLDWDHATSPEMLREFMDMVEYWGIPPTIFVSGAAVDCRLHKDVSSMGSYKLRDARDELFGYSALPSDSKFSESLSLMKKWRCNRFLEFPVKTFSAEIGNHMYTHFGGPESWWSRVPNDGVELENDLKKMDVLAERIFKMKPVLWSRPSYCRYPDSFSRTLVSSGYKGTSNYRYKNRPWRRPALSVTRLGGISEVGSNFPRDPFLRTDVELWLSKIMFCNMHSRGYDSHSVLGSHLGPPFFHHARRGTEAVFKSVLESSSWPCTISEMMKYMDTAESLSVSLLGNAGFEVRNESQEDAEMVPFEIKYNKNKRFIMLVSCEAGKNKGIGFNGS